ncbi:dTDP-4-dehydrorhamnose 3,5-epimerase [Patescibacteria group bacterium]|nr:MAG: dTDP-4-dehydrorhamnose 3,5-epimerase [Patescibacteria group bacterium]
MAEFKFKKTDLEDVYVIEPEVFGDQRGFFMETYNKEEFKKHGVNVDFVQDNHSKSKKGVLRGLHFQEKYPQGKLVRVIKGKVYDVAVDLRKSSKTFGKWFGIELSAENKKMFWVPGGFAHGFVTLEDDTEFVYKCDQFYHPEDEGGLIWNDPGLKIDWPIENPTLSEKDQDFPTLKKLNFFFK